MKRLISASLLLSLLSFIQFATPALAKADACGENVITAATQDAQQIASEEDLAEDCYVDNDGLTLSSPNSYSLKVECGDELSFIYDVSVVREKGNCQIDDMSEIAP